MKPTSFAGTNIDILKSLFLEAEATINKTGAFDETGQLYCAYQEWSAAQTHPMPFMFLNELYYEICRQVAGVMVTV